VPIFGRVTRASELGVRGEVYQPTGAAGQLAACHLHGVVGSPVAEELLMRVTTTPSG
jgi:hypothetical protein